MKKEINLITKNYGEKSQTVQGCIQEQLENFVKLNQKGQK